MEFSVFCDYHSYLIGSDFKMWFSCSCLRPDRVEEMKKLQPPADGSLEPWQQRVLFALHWGDCRLSHMGSGGIVFDGHEFIASAEGKDSVKVKFNDDCIFTVRREDVIEY